MTQLSPTDPVDKWHWNFYPYTVSATDSHA
jgi:hypothetical protein